MFDSGKKKAHKHKLFLSGWSWDDPGFVLGISPGLSLGQIRWKSGISRVFSLFYTVEARQTRVCPRDKPGFFFGTNPGPKGGTESLYEESLCAFSLAIDVPHLTFLAQQMIVILSPLVFHKAGTKKPWQPQTWRDSTFFSPLGNRAIFSTFWGPSLTKVHRKPGENGRLIFIHLQCWEVLPFSHFQRQRCIKIWVLRAQDFYTPLALKTAKGQHLPALEVYKNQCPRKRKNPL